MCTGLEVALIAGTALSAVGSLQAGKAQAAAMEFNAQLAEREALRQREIAAIEEERFRRAADKQQARRLVALAASGVDVSTGTGIDLLSEAETDDEFDAQLIRYGGKVGAAQQRAQAAADRLAARAYRIRGTTAALGALADGASIFFAPTTAKTTTATE